MEAAAAAGKASQFLLQVPDVATDLQVSLEEQKHCWQLCTCRLVTLLLVCNGQEQIRTLFIGVQAVFPSLRYA